jgi:hypothetical protein
MPTERPVDEAGPERRQVAALPGGALFFSFLNPFKKILDSRFKQA